MKIAVVQPAVIDGEPARNRQMLSRHLDAAAGGDLYIAPEMFRRLVLKDVDLFVVPSEWPFPREHALRIMTEARAVENQAFVALANRIGLDSHGNNFCDGSGIFGPQGALPDVLGCGSTASVDIDIKKLHDLRASFPVLSHRLEVVDHA